MGQKRPLFTLLLWSLALGLLGWVLWSTPLVESWAALRRLQGWQIGALVLANVVVLLSLNGRWWLLLRGLGHHVPYLTLTGHRLAAFAVSYFTPGPQFGGEPVQVLLVEREHDVPRAAALTAVTLDKSLELLTNFGFLALGVGVVLRVGLLGDMVGGEAAVLAALLLAIPTLMLVALWSGWMPLTRLLRLGALLLPAGWQERYRPFCHTVQVSEVQAAQFFHEAPFTLLLALLISSLSWILMLAEYWLLLSLLGASLTAVQTITALTAARIAFLLPLPGGLGALEASQMLVLGALGMNPATGVSASLIIRLRDVALAGMGLWWLRRRWQKRPLAATDHGVEGEWGKGAARRLLPRVMITEISEKRRST